MTSESTLTSKGQTTIPKNVRETLRLKSGDRIMFTLMPDGTVQLRAKNRSAASLGGLLRKPGQKRVATGQLSR